MTTRLRVPAIAARCSTCSPSRPPRLLTYGVARSAGSQRRCFWPPSRSVVQSRIEGAERGLVVEFRMLGLLEVARDGAPVAFRGQR